MTEPKVTIRIKAGKCTSQQGKAWGEFLSMLQERAGKLQEAVK